MERRLGMLGCGRLGQALLEGWLEAGIADRGGVRIADPASATATAARLGVTAASPAEVVAHSDLVVLAVKPQHADGATRGLAFRPGQILVSVMAGIGRGTLEALCGPATVVRAMPNMACQVGAGATLVLGGSTPTEAVDRTRALFSAVGHVEVLEKEALFHVGTALVGSAPAWLFVAQEALADGAVAAGLPRAQAIRLAARVLGGAGALAAAGAHPAALKDAVASPGGTTIYGLRALERAGFRSALFEAVLAATDRSMALETR